MTPGQGFHAPHPLSVAICSLGSCCAGHGSSWVARLPPDSLTPQKAGILGRTPSAPGSLSKGEIQGESGAATTEQLLYAGPHTCCRIGLTPPHPPSQYLYGILPFDVHMVPCHDLLKPQTLSFYVWRSNFPALGLAPVPLILILRLVQVYLCMVGSEAEGIVASVLKLLSCSHWSHLGSTLSSATLWKLFD